MWSHMELATSKASVLKQSLRWTMSVEGGWFHFTCGYAVLMISSLIQTTMSATLAPPYYGQCHQSPSNLTTLDCSLRNITDLNSSLSAIPNPNLFTNLDLSQNSIQQLGSKSFVSFTQLSILSLRSNVISSIASDAFQGLNNLKQLYLDNNKLQTFPASNVFKSVPNLIKLHVSFNSLESVPANAFQHLVHLQQLDLQFSGIATLDHSAFNWLSQIERINLAGNKLSHLANGTFHVVQTLKHLNLSSLGLTRLDSAVIQPLATLQTLDISGNKLTTVSRDTVTVLTAMTNLVSFNASNNPIKCDCNNKHFIVWIQNLTFISDRNSPLCDSPPGLYEVNLLNISSIAVSCDNTPAVLPIPTPSFVTTGDPNVSSMDPLPYDPMLGWYTAAVLGSVLLLFLVCLLLDKLKRKYYKALKRKLKKLEKEEKLQMTLTTADKDSGLDTPTMLCSISVNTEADDVIETGVDAAAEPLNKDLNSNNERKASICSNTSHKLKLAQENSRRNNERSVLSDGYHPLSGNDVIDKRDNKNIIPPLEVVPGITILEVNPDCPLHRLSGHHAKPKLVPPGAYNVYNSVPNNVHNTKVTSTKL